MTWLFGALAISSVFIIVGWGRALHRNWTPFHLRNVPMLVALGMVLHSVALFAFTGLRTMDMLAGYDFGGSDPLLIAVFLLMLLASKVTLVWASALWRRERHVGVSWWFFLGCMAGWTLWLLA